MRVWRQTAMLQRDGSDRLRTSLSGARTGFEQKGKILLDATIEELTAALRDEPDAIAAGSIAFVRRALDLLGVEPPAFPDYPASLAPFLGRELRRATLAEALRGPDDGRLFVKPAASTKLFDGFVLDGVRSTFAVSGIAPETPVWLCGRVRFLSEWRTYVVEHRIAKLGHYRGDPLVFPDGGVVRRMLSAMVEAGEAPTSFVIDVGIAETGETLLVEANDGYAVGNYGLQPLDYAHLLETRWDEMVAGHTDVRPS